jgi:hypothetical protein
VTAKPPRQLIISPLEVFTAATVEVEAPEDSVFVGDVVAINTGAETVVVEEVIAVVLFPDAAPQAWLISESSCANVSFTDVSQVMHDAT